MKKTIIGICDDQESALKELEKIITDICKQKNGLWEVRAYSVGEELIKQIQEITIAFLDIEMPKMDGIEIGKIIREKNPKCKIVMATGTVERFKEAFKIRAVSFVTKPFDRAEIAEALQVAGDIDFGVSTIELYCQRNKYEIYQEEIQYIEAYNGYAEFTVKGRIFRRDISLDDVEKIVDKRLFMRINRKMIVNLRWIQTYQNNKLQIGVREFSVSRRKKKEFEHRYIEYDLKYRREFE